MSNFLTPKTARILLCFGLGACLLAFLLNTATFLFELRQKNTAVSVTRDSLEALEAPPFGKDYVIHSEGNVFAYSFDYDIHITKKEFEQIKDGDDIVFYGGNRTLGVLVLRYLKKLLSEILIAALLIWVYRGGLHH